MADGRKIPYIIEMIADDSTLRNQMKKWDWEDIMGSKGKGFADILGQEGKEAKEQIENALMKLDLDWAKIFGMDKLEAALSRTFKKSRTKIESAIADVDTNKLKTTIEFIEGLGKAFEEMDAKFEAGSAARSLAPLLRALEQMPEAAKRVEAAFGSLSEKLDKSNKPIVITPSFDFAKADKDVEDLKRRLNDLDKKVNIKLDLDDNQVTDKVDEIVYHVGEANDKIKKLQNELDAPETSKEREREVRVELAKQIALRTDYYRTIAKMKSHYGKVVDDFLLGEDDFKGLNLTKEIKNSKDQIKNLIGEISSVSSSTQSNDVRIGVSLPSAEDIRSAVNAEIIKLNKRKDALQSVKIQIDPTGIDINEATSKVTTTDKDNNFIQNINQRFDAISKVIKTRQDEIVTQTKDVWRKEILQQLKFRSSDFEFNFGDALIENLQAALDEADFKIKVDTEFLASQIRTIIENTNAPLGVGVANINPESMKSAVREGVRSALFGESMLSESSSSSTSVDIAEGTQDIAKETEDVAKRLDIAEDYVKDVVEKIRAVAKYAVKPEDKDSPGAKATRDKFSRLGLDLTQIKNAGNDDAKIASILEESLLTKGDDGQLVGRTIIDELSGFKDSTSKTIPAFLTSLHEVFYMLQESTQSVEEWTRINKSRTILDDARKKAQDAMALLDVRKTIKKGEVPTIAEIDELTSTMEPYLEQIAKRSLSYSGKKIEELAQEKRKANPSLDFGKSIEEARREIYEQILSSIRASFTDLKTAREILGDKTDEASMAEFQSAAESFYKSSTNIFNNLKKQAEDMFKGEIYLKGGENGHIKKRDINTYKQLASIKDDDILVDIRVTSSLNNVAIGEAKSEYDEQRLMRGQRADYLVDKTHEEDILRRQLKYKGFNPQGSDDTPVNIETSIEGMQKRIAKADEDIPKLQEQIRLLDKEVEIKRQEAKTARAFLETITNNPNATEAEKRNANTADMHAYGKLYDVISARGALTRQVDDLKSSQERSRNLIEQLKLTEQYNNLLTKSLELEGSIIKMEKDGVSQKELKKRKEELAEIHIQLTDIKSAADVFGGLYQQSIGKEYSAAERKTYALEQLKLIDNDLITARAQKSVIGARMSKKDREIAEVNKYGLGAGIGARELGREKNRVTSEFIRSEYVTSLINEARDQTKNAIAKAVSKSELAETNMLREFNNRVANAMIQDGLNPYSDKQTTEFMETSRGKQYSQDYNKSIETIRGELERDTRTMWTLYDERVKTIRTQVMTEFKESLKTENGVLRYMSKTKDDVTGEWVSEIVEVDVRKALKERLEEERRILKEQLEGDAKSGKPAIQSEIERLESDRRTAIEYGGVGESEILSADIIKDQIRKEEKLVELQEKRATKLQELNDLERAGLSEDDESVKQAQKKIANLDKEIARYEMLVRDRQKLVELRWDESKADNYTAEEKELHFTEQIVNYNQKIEDSLVRQEDLKEKLNNATEEEKTKLQYQLDQEESKVEKWRQGISTLEGKIQKIGNERISGVAENAISTSKSDGVLVDLIKKSAGGEDIDDEKLSEIVEVLNNILNVLTGGKVVEDSARSEVAATATKKNSTKKYADDFNFVDALNKQAAEVKKHNQGTKEYILEQAKLYRLLWDYKNNTANLKTLKNDKFLERAKVKALGLDPTLIKAKDRTQAFKDAGGTGKLDAEVSKFIDKFKVVVEGATKESRKQPVSNQQTDVGLGSIAREDTLSKILDVLNTFKSNGVKVTSTKQSETKTKEPKVEKTEAELIRDRATSQKDAVLASAAGKGSLFKKFNQNLKDLDDAVAEANKASETEKAKAIANVKAKAQKVSALSYNILKNTSEWDYIVAQSDSGAQDLKLKKGQSPRDKMEQMAKMEAGVLGRNGKELKKPKNQYKFLGFDGETLTYQLTDIEGKTRNVTMVWNEFTNQVAITSDKSVAKLDTLASKVETFGEKFKNATQMGYLAEDDETYKKFLDKVADIDTQSTLKDVERVRNEALQLADEVTKKVNANKKLYTGTSEMNAADRQYGKLESSGILNQTDLKLVEEYKNKYNEIVAIQEKWKAQDGGKGLLREDAQKELYKTALEAQNLGVELEKAAKTSQRLQDAMHNSGIFNGQKIGAEFQVADAVNVYDQMVAKLKELGAEHIKVDRVRKIATGTIRHNNRSVSELTVEYDKLRGSLARYQKQERESLIGLPAFINGFQKKFNSIMQYLTMTMSIYRVMSQLRRGVQYVREIDLALTELRKVTDETEKTYDRFLQTAAKTGERLGATISAVTEATATFAKLGYSMAQATEMAESAIVYKNVGDNIASTEDAADSIISTMKGFGLEATESMAIVDKFNEVGNRFAITSQGIGEALRLSASALNEGKNSLDESIALITAANEVVNDPSSVGTALKTLTLRLRGSKTELEEMGEDVTDMATTTSQLQAKLLALTGGKVDIMLDANTFKNTTQILREMAGAWEDMNDIQRASALELMGGKRQANTLSALIQNFDTVEEAIEASVKSAGSALKENERYLDSIQGRIDQFNNALQSMWNNIFSDDLVKFIVQAGTELLKLIDSLGVVKTLVIGIGTYLIQKNFKGDLFGGLFNAQTIDEAKDRLKNLKKEIETLQGKKKNPLRDAQIKGKQKKASALGASIDEYDKLSEELKNYRTELTNTEKALDTVNAKIGSRIAKGKEPFKKDVEQQKKLQAQYDQTNAKISETEAKLKQAESQALKTGTAGLNAGNKIKAGFKSAGKAIWQFSKQLISSLTTMYLFTTIMELFAKAGEALADWFDGLEETATEAHEKFEELNNELSSTESELRSLESELNTTNDRIEELLSQDTLTLVEQDELEKLQSTTSELERQIELTKELQKLQQTSVNTASLNAMGKYTAGTSFYSEKSKTERQEEAEETGKTIGNVAGIALGALGAAIVGYFTGGTMTAQGYMVGASIGSFLGGQMFGAIGASSEGSAYDSEMTVEEALDRMAIDTKKFKEAERAAHEAYAKSNSEEDKQRWTEASQALNDYQNNLATSISQIQAYINSIDYSALTDPSEKQEYLDALDDTLAYAIIQGVQGAERLAIESIFSEKLITEDAQTLMDAITSALKFNEDVDFMDFEDGKFDAIKARLAGVGLTVTDLIYHFANLKEKAEASLLIEPEDMVKSISKLSDSVSELKSAFDEFNESGVVTAETLMKLSETFGQLDGWKGFIDLASSGVASVQEMEDSINLLVENLVDNVIDNPFQLGYDNPTTEINEAIEDQKSYWTTIAQMQELGVTNARELVNAMQQKAVVKAVINEVNAYDKLLEKQETGTKLTEDEHKLLKDYATREDYQNYLIEEYKTKYGLNELSAENLALIDEQIDKQMQLFEQSEKVEKLDKLKGNSFTDDNDLLKKFTESLENVDIDALEKFKASLDPGEDVVSAYAKIREEYDELDQAVSVFVEGGYYKDHPLLDTIIDWTEGEGWDDLTYDAFSDSLDEILTLGLAETDLDKYDDLVQARGEKFAELYGVSDEMMNAVKDRQDWFKQLTDIAKEYDIDLSGIDLTSFDATDVGSKSIFKQVYDTVYNALYGENGEGGLIAEWEAEEKRIKESLDTAFDDIGLEVILELQDKNKLVDDIQSIYDELSNAQKEYSENGYLSVDTMQSLLQLEPKYLDMLVDEEGNINLTKDALYEVARARITDLGIKQQTAIYEQALALATSGSKNALLEYISTMETATEVGQDWHEQQLELIGDALAKKVLDKEITQEEANAFIAGIQNQITAVQTVTQSALDNLNNSLSTSGNTATEEANNAFQNAMDYWENRIGAAESRFEQIQHEIDTLESQGKKAGAGYYQEQIKQLQEFDSAGNLVGGKLYLLNQQLAEAQSMLSDPNIKEGSDEWWEIANTINDIEAEIDDVTLSIQDLNDAMADTHWYVFDEAHDRISTLASDLENIRDILSNEELFDDEGNFTKEGLGTLATYVQELGVFEGALANAKAEMELFGDAYDPNKTYVDLQGNNLSIDSEQDWYEAAQKAEEQYDEWNQKVIETRYNIKDLYEQQIDSVEEYTESLIENYQDYIDAVKEALDSERDLYEFKKSTEQKSKNIASIERRIASLSGSTNAADVAERRKLQAELTEAKSDMDDHYYSRAKEQQSQALDDEVTAYETAMNAYIEGLRTKLEESTADLYKSYEEMSTGTQSFIDGVTQGVILNAGNVKEVYLSTGETIDQTLVTPWTNAANAIGAFASSEGALGMMNSWTEAKAGAPFYDFQTKASQYLSTPWTSITGAGGVIDTFKTNVTNTMNGIVNDVNKNVSSIISHLQTEINKIKDTDIRVDVEYNVTGNGSGNDGKPKITIAGAGGGGRSGFAEITLNSKGSLGTKTDGYHITDESWIGEEITLAAGKNGQLQYLKKGSAIMPADISANLVEWGKMNPNMMNLGVAPNVNMISNAVNKPEFNFAFDALVKAENITEETLPAVKKLVTQELNRFTKELNYALKGKGAR